MCDKQGVFHQRTRCKSPLLTTRLVKHPPALQVGVTLVSLGLEDVPGVSTLRLMRAFRVLRLFGRYKQCKNSKINLLVGWKERRFHV